MTDPTKFDARQSVSRDALDQVASAAGKQVDALLRAINSELTMPLRLTASSTPNLTVNIGNITVTNPETNRKRIIPHISNIIPTFASGTVTIPASSGGNITFSTGGSTPVVLTCPSGQYVKVLIYLDALGNLGALVGVTAGTEAGAAVPPAVRGTFSIGFLSIHNTGGTIDNVANTNIYQFVGGGGGGGSGSGDASSILETIKNMMIDSPFELVTPNIFDQEEDDLVDVSSTGAFSLINRSFDMDTGETMVSIQMLDASEFLIGYDDVSSVDLALFWKSTAIDTAAICEVSRDGGSHYTALSMSRVGYASETYIGSYTWPREEEDAYADSFAATSTAVTLTDTAGTKEALAQEFVLANADPTRVVSFGLQLAKGGSPAGSYRITLQNDNAGLPSGAILASSPWTLCSTLSGAASVVNITTDTYLANGTYHVVVETDADYKAGYTANSANNIKAYGANTGTPVGSYFDAGVWAAESVNKYSFQLSGWTESYAIVNTYADTNGDSYFTLNATTQLKIGQPFTLTASQTFKRVTLYMRKTGSPSGNVYVSIVKDNAGFPSTSSADVIAMSNAFAVANISGAAPITVTVDIPHATLPAGTYHLVVSTDLAYQSSFVLSTTEIAVHVDSTPSVSVANQYSSSWSATTVAMTYQLKGRTLDLRVKVTASGNSKSLDAYAVFYKQAAAGPVGGLKKIEVKSFNSVSDNFYSFTLSNFLPDPDLLSVYHVETGQVYRYGSFYLQGYSVVFPVNTFNNNGLSATVTLRFEQLSGTSFDNSDQNAALLAANALGSTNATIDKSIPGRGLFLRRPDGTLREIALDNSDNLVVYSV